MKKFIIWTLAALVLMLGFPFLAVQFAGTNGMAVCFILGMFFIIVEIVKPFKESLRKIFYVG